MDYLTIEIEFKGEKRIVELEGGMGNIPTPEQFAIGESLFQIEYGAIRKSIPFYIHCKDFQLDNYPGSRIIV